MLPRHFHTKWMTTPDSGKVRWSVRKKKKKEVCGREGLGKKNATGERAMLFIWRKSNWATYNRRSNSRLVLKK